MGAAVETRADQDALVEAFRRDGFVHVKGLMSPDEIDRHRANVDAAVAGRTAQDLRSHEEKTPFQQSFTMCQCLWEDHPAVGALTFHPKVAGLAARLIEAERVRLWHDQALYKEAGARETEMHQDHPYWPIAERRALTAWIPLVDIDETNGCMGYIPGSHLGEIEYVDLFQTPGSGHAFEARQTGKPVFVACKRGDVIYHHGATIHTAMPNRSGEVRRVHTAIYFADGCTRGDERPHHALERQKIALGAPIDGAPTPIAWPLEGGRLPTPLPFAPMEDHPKFGNIAKMGIFPIAR
jgi:ectoine hydroxylase-related dioxygenase (phytanoyl-CoA dioxygenase family)